MSSIEGTGHTRMEHPVISDSLDEVMRCAIKSNTSWLCLYNSPIIFVMSAKGARREAITREDKTSQFIAIRRSGYEEERRSRFYCAEMR